MPMALCLCTDIGCCRDSCRPTIPGGQEMGTHSIKAAVVSVGIALLAACASIEGARVWTTPKKVARPYPQLRQIAIEEAQSHGFGTLIGETRPAPANGWQGHLAFQAAGADGTSQLTVQFLSRAE